MNNNDHKNLENEFNVLRFINKKPNTNQREIAKKLGLSLGKLNYCLQQLKKKGFVKINNFKKNENKSGYLYLLTPRGIMEKTKITLAFSSLASFISFGPGARSTEYLFLNSCFNF